MGEEGWGALEGGRLMPEVQPCYGVNGAPPSSYTDALTPL